MPICRRSAKEVQAAPSSRLASAGRAVQSPPMADPQPGWIGPTPRLAGRALVKAYRYTLSPLIGFHCRHLPTCSEYADEALDRYGLWAGSWMTLARLLRCQPWGTSGIDRVPAVAPPGAHWCAPWRYARWWR